MGLSRCSAYFKRPLIGKANAEWIRWLGSYKVNPGKADALLKCHNYYCYYFETLFCFVLGEEQFKPWPLGKITVNECISSCYCLLQYIQGWKLPVLLKQNIFIVGENPRIILTFFSKKLFILHFSKVPEEVTFYKTASCSPLILFLIQFIRT